MNAALDAAAAIQLAQFIQSSMALYQAGVLTQQQLSDAWNAVGINVTNADKLWVQAGA